LDSEDPNERLALRAATTTMVLVTAVTVLARVLFMGPFTDLFDTFLVYLPTAVLLATAFRSGRKNRTVIASQL
jgi:hypothetical protein